MALIGLDLNASRIRAATGPSQGLPRETALDGAVELPLALSLEQRHVQVGKAGIAICRKLPHLACVNFLAYLGEKREWTGGRHRLDAARALSLVLERVQPACSGMRGLVVALPAYLSAAQVSTVVGLAEKARLPLLGSLASPMATALAGYGSQPWVGRAVVVDIDEHALTWSLVSADGEGLVLEQALPLPALGMRSWTERLLDGISDRCIRLSRRDPRATADTEQRLYEQLAGVLTAYQRGQVIELGIQSTTWFQHVMLRPEELEAFCGSLVRQALEGLQTLLAERKPPALALTEAASALPGLAAGVMEKARSPAPLTIVPADGPAASAHELAGLIEEARLPRGTLDGLLPLPRRAPRPEVRIQPPPGRLRIMESGF